MNDRVAGYVRTAATLGVLALLLLFGVTRGLSSVSKPFPKGEAAPICVDSALAPGDVLRVGAITVNVVNAGSKSGLARTTLDDLQEQGFDGGRVANLPDPAVRTVEIRVAGGRTPAARLLRTYLGSQVRIVDDPAATTGVTVVVGDRFDGLRKGRNGIRITEDASVCSPAALA